jgi:hypothetical protein
MSISHTSLVKLRPYLFHLTAASNVERILRNRRIESALALLVAADRRELVRQRRRGHVQVEVDRETVQLRDQAPLHRGNMALEEGWAFEDFVEHLNERVFFWPGTASGPISYGMRHYERYKDEGPAILRVATAALVAENVHSPPLFCRYNSGSPRCSNGHKSPRTAQTFVAADRAEFGVGGVVEVTFVGTVRLPRHVEVGGAPGGPWRSR